MFTPLLRHVKKGERVGVVGIGGLGHLAIQFASRWGCEVVAFSGSESKREEAMRLGAKEFVVMGRGDGEGARVLADGIGKLDHLLVTTAAHPKWSS